MRPQAGVASRGRPLRRRRTPLEYGLMCLVARAPMSGSQLVSLLRHYPLAGSGQSPGAVYPALYRLEDAGLLCRRTRRPRRSRDPFAPTPPPRGVQEFGLTRDGLTRLRLWATSRVTRADVLARPEHLLLRFAMCTGLAGPTAARRLALQCRRVCRVLAAELAHEIDRHRGSTSTSARLAMECTLALLEARATWSHRAEIELARHAARAPELDLPPPARDVLAVLERLPTRIRAWIRWPLRDGLPPTPARDPPPGARWRARRGARPTTDPDASSDARPP